jgi:hypothetical protein
MFCGACKDARVIELPDGRGELYEFPGEPTIFVQPPLFLPDPESPRDDDFKDEAGNPEEDEDGEDDEGNDREFDDEGPEEHDEAGASSQDRHTRAKKGKAKADEDSHKKRKDLSARKVFNPRLHARVDRKVRRKTQSHRFPFS